MSGLDSGALDRRVSILRATLTDDGFATTPGEPQEVGVRWASKFDVSDRERSAAAQQGSAITTRFQMRWDSLTSTINTQDSLRLEGATYTISAVKELGRREGIEITAARRDDGA